MNRAAPASAEFSARRHLRQGQDDDMAFQARVYLRRPRETSSTLIGKILVEMLPPGSPLRLHWQIKFTYEGKVEIGRVDGIVRGKSSEEQRPRASHALRSGRNVGPKTIALAARVIAGEGH